MRELQFLISTVVMLRQCTRSELVVVAKNQNMFEGLGSRQPFAIQICYTLAYTYPSWPTYTLTCKQCESKGLKLVLCQMATHQAPIFAGNHRLLLAFAVFCVSSLQREGAQKLSDVIPVCRTFQDFTSQGGTWSRVHNGSEQTEHIWQPVGCSQHRQDLALDERAIQRKLKRIVLLGDSMMGRTAKSFVNTLEKSFGKNGLCHMTQSGDRCGEATGILGLQPPHWECTRLNGCNGHSAAAEGEGPLGFGAHHPGCRDCSGCDAAFVHCGALRVDFIAVEWARDVELQTLHYNTTQEVVATEHFRKDPPDMVIFNTGAHDIDFFQEHGSKFYETHLRWYTELLLARNVPVLFLNSASIADNLIPEQYRHVTSDEFIQQANHIARQIMQEMRVPYLDAYKISSDKYAQALREDAVHFKKEYYNEICRILLIVIFGHVTETSH